MQFPFCFQFNSPIGRISHDDDGIILFYNLHIFLRKNVFQIKVVCVRLTKRQCIVVRTILAQNCSKYTYIPIMFLTIKAAV